MPVIRRSSSYIPRGEGVSGVGAPITSDLSFAAIAKEKWGKEKNKLLAVLDILASGQQGLAGVTMELARREAGYRPTPLISSFRGGALHSTSFNQITGDPVSGLLLDLIVDPINIVGGTGLPRIAGKIAAKVPGVTRVGKGMYEVTEAVPHIRKVKESAGVLFRAKHMLRKKNPKEVLEILESHRGNINYNLHMAGKKVANEIEKLVPDQKVRMNISMLMDEEPVIKVAGADEFARWKAGFDGLADKEKTAYLLARTHFDALEKVKLNSGLITHGRIAGFYEKFKRKYIPYREATKDTFLEDARRVRAAADAGDTDALELIAKYDGGMDEFDELIAAAEKTDDIWLPLRERARKKYLEGDMPSFTMKRGTDRTMGEIVDEGIQSIEADLAHLVQIEAREVANAQANKIYVKRLLDFCRKNDLVYEASDMQNPQAFKKLLETRIGKKEAASRIREGFVPLKVPIEGLENYVIPKTINSEIGEALSKAMDPEGYKKVIAGITKLVQFDKAWRLVVFPEYHVRNYFSNKFNNFLGGVDPVRQFKHYKAATYMLKRWMKGEGIFESAAKGREAGKFFGMTEPELYRYALKNRIISGGETMGEVGMLFEDAVIHRNVFAKWLDPRTSPMIQKGFKTGRWVEDRDRLAHFLAKMDDGMSAQDAAASVRKFLFDYRYGLSKFETDFLRNALVPFWAWTRFNVPLQVEMLILQPHKYTPFIKGKRFIEDQWGGPTPEDIEEAEWVRRTLSLRVRYDEKTGDYKYFVLDSWWPAADLGRFWGKRAGAELLNMVNPWAKVPGEVIENYNLFQRRPVQRFKGEKKKLLGISLDARIDHLARTIRQINTTDKLIQTLTDRYREKPTLETAGWAVGQLFIGKIYPQDPAKQKKWWKFEINNRIRELKGLLKSAERRGDTPNIKRLKEEIKAQEKLKREHLGIYG